MYFLTKAVEVVFLIEKYTKLFLLTHNSPNYLE